MSEREKAASPHRRPVDGVTRAHDFLRSHFRRSPSLQEIAEVSGLSRFHFHRLFRQRYGKTPKQLITELQVAEVQRLAREGVPLSDAAFAAGFLHQSHMTVRFKQIVGQTPRRWLRAAGAGMGAVLVLAAI